MLSLQVLAKSKLAQSVARLLDGLEGARAVTLTPAVRAVPEIDITVTRLETVGRLGASASEVSVLWSVVIGAAWRQARPIGRYLVFMFAAGVIACYGVTDDNGILIVGAMAVSPDLLPIVAVGVGVVGRNLGLAGRALLTLALGLLLASLAAAIFGFAQDQLDLIPSGFSLHKTGVLGGLTSVNDETIVVAFVAGWLACWRSKPVPARRSASRSR